ISRRVQRRDRWKTEQVYALFPKLQQLRRSLALNLSGGEQKMLAIGRALMGSPDLLLLDEPSEGLGPLVVQLLAGAIEAIRDAGVAILIADQNVRFCRRVAHRGYIIDRGVIRFEGPLDAIWQSEETVREYLAI
ncbi:MAG: ATP-binding cassette domain-containing protein, partial [Actinobacteria bacterium]|nr:ATP-binding cassette domain-containing protein [Actinomycetota bacterium]